MTRGGGGVQAFTEGHLVNVSVVIRRDFVLHDPAAVDELDLPVGKQLAELGALRIAGRRTVTNGGQLVRQEKPVNLHENLQGNLQGSETR